jgi:hypothetical protein
VRPELDESKKLKKKESEAVAADILRGSKKLKKIGSEAVAADILRGWRIVSPELDTSETEVEATH